MVVTWVPVSMMAVISFKPDLLERDPEDFNSFQLNDFKFTSVYVLKSALNGTPKVDAQIIHVDIGSKPLHTGVGLTVGTSVGE